LRALDAGRELLFAAQQLLPGRRSCDGQSVCRAFSRGVLRTMEIICEHNCARVMTLNIVRRGYLMMEVPLTYKVRETGKSFIRGWTYLKRVIPGNMAGDAPPHEQRKQGGPGRDRV